jgi:probable rRNA maturation factor
LDRQLITFYGQELSGFQTNLSELESWVATCLAQLEKNTYVVTYVFMNNKEHLKLNQKALQHDYYTDIITFDLSEDYLHAEIYINLDMVAENAISYSSSNTNELKRVMIHGILHLCGFDDRTDEDKAIMREKEDEFIDLI